ncbi:hypothetical protein AXF42_Ash005688 [Apostasia shenzhenica]|uniref:DUF506 family protein n=1 Tax=Apostasia shenzhenica TaxID=1088818 RepID=A0A2I0BC33_9ASPA|nr:hypothetical protein AXF42_Ash005688 [Apostasia shenzhenica]
MAESLADMVLGFFEDESTAGSSGSDGWVSDGEGDGDGDGGGSAESKAFWELQEQLLQEALLRRGSTETRIRVEMEEILRKMTEDCGSACDLSGISGGGGVARRWVLVGIVDRLREKGYDSAVCRSKWQRSPDIPSGEHSYIDVVMESRGEKKGSTRVVIEPSFRAEFEVARGSSEYNALVARLPEMFAGKPERLRTVVKIMCRAAKRCMKENRMHMGPWRKHEYMLSKWLGTCERVSQPLPLALPARSYSGAGASDERRRRPTASLLTFDLHCTAVEVV